MAFVFKNSLNDIIFGSFTPKFAFFAHFMHFRSTICYDIRAFSRGKFISKELICAKYLTLCNSVLLQADETSLIMIIIISSSSENQIRNQSQI